MNYPCNVIRDLLPLYLDKVCSEESKQIIEMHLEHCPECQTCFRSMAEADPKMDEAMASDASIEYQRASSLRAIRKKLLCRQAITAVLVVLALAALAGLIVQGLKRSTHIVSDESDLSVSMVDGNLMGRLYGSEYSSLKVKAVPVRQDDQTLQCLFYCISHTQWDDLVTSKNVFSEYVICPKEKGADAVDRVYYYTGEYTGLESMSGSELEAIVESSTLLWQR